jgi:D-alanyl-D-alanine endopeptidase (penicillin-binding protein 7)
MVRRASHPWVVGTVLLVLSSLGLPVDSSATSGRGSASVRKSTTAGQNTAKVKKAKKKRARVYATRSARARRARLARLRAERARAQWLEAATPRYKLDANGALVPDVRAAAAIIYNPETGDVVWEENSQNKRSIASITKVMTAAVVLEDAPDLSRQVVIERSDVYRANHTYLRVRDRVSIDDLLHLALIASDNAAARALARTSPEGPSGFIERMNGKALELGLESTSYADPSGLDPDNISSAYDMARLIAFAASDERIASIMRKQHHSLNTGRRKLSIHSTNQLVMKGDVDVRGGKTGFISKAGYCLATLLRLPQTGQQFAVVVLGARSNVGRFMETRHLFNWVTNKAQDVFSADTFTSDAVAADAVAPAQ